MNPNPNPNPTFRKNESQSQSQSQKFSNSIPIPIPIPKFSEFNPNPNPNPKNSTKSQTIPRNFWDPNPKNIFMENVLNRKKERNSSKTKQNPCSKVLEPERFYFNECFFLFRTKVPYILTRIPTPQFYSRNSTSGFMAYIRFRFV